MNAGGSVGEVPQRELGTDDFGGQFGGGESTRVGRLLDES